ncbi:MAG: hypothetical protein HY762_02825, partial [Planctomycetes bacterium]|nr:hypothetical protein [Planctomycetota bacterium]
ALNRDFSNIKEVLNKFRHTRYRAKMVDETYDYIMASHTYKHRIDKIISLIK